MEPVLIARYHNTPDGEWHKGHSKDCSICAMRKQKEALAKRAKRNGRLGGKVRAGELESPRRTCSGCGKFIENDNKSGLCRACLNAAKAEKKALKPSRYKGTCKSCDRKIYHSNVTGFCSKCYRKSDIWKQHAKQHGDYMNAVLTKADQPS